MTRIEFRTKPQEAAFHSPLHDMELVRQALELRFDPLTGRQSIYNSALADKAAAAFPETDFDYLQHRAEATRERCFLCSQDWKKHTPTYPEALIPTGILERGQAALFPNLFPVAPFHSLIRVGDKHLRTLDDFPIDLLADAFSVALEFVLACHAYDPGMRYATMNANYQLPAGASLMHPHFQILGSSEASTHHAQLLEKSAEYRARNGGSYWLDLVEEEKDRGERWIGQINQSCWMTSFAPMGQNEVLAVWPWRQSFLDWSEQDVWDLAAGLSHVLRVWHQMRLSSFNFSCFSAPLGEDSPHFCSVLRMVTRQNVIPDHRTDDYFLQKLMRNELILNRPEKLAQWMRKDFPES
jgi:galactose-1-phosphate uridylyltransferase